MLSPRVFVTRQIFPEALDLISELAQVEVWPEDRPPSPEELTAKITSADGVLTTIMDRVDVPLLDQAHRLKVISQLAVGLDNIDLAEASRRSIPGGLHPGGAGQSHGRPGFRSADVGCPPHRRKRALGPGRPMGDVVPPYVLARCGGA